MKSLDLMYSDDRDVSISESIYMITFGFITVYSYKGVSIALKTHFLFPLVCLKCNKIVEGNQTMYLNCVHAFLCCFCFLWIGFVYKSWFCLCCYFINFVFLYYFNYLFIFYLFSWFHSILQCVPISKRLASLLGAGLPYLIIS